MLGKRRSPRLNTGEQYPGANKTHLYPASNDSTTCNYSHTNKENYTLALCVHATIDMEGHLTMNVHMNKVSVVALVDSGATGVFMHPDFAKHCNATIRMKTIPREVRIIDGRTISSGLITHETTVDLIVNGHREKLLANITNTGRYDCILGTPWLVCHDPTIQWSQRKVLFDSLYCQHTCFGGLLQDAGSEEKPTTYQPRTAPTQMSATVFHQLTREATIYCMEISEVASDKSHPFRRCMQT